MVAGAAARRGRPADCARPPARMAVTSCRHRRVDASQQAGRAGVSMRMNGYKAPPAREPDPEPPSDAKRTSKKKSARDPGTAEDGSQDLALEGIGDLVLTNKNLSFLSDTIALKIALRHI